MKVVQLEVDNLQRIKAVQIAPTGNMVTIGGKNGQGKSSILDAIWIAIKGRSAAPPVPVRLGEQKCTIKLDLGELVITRTFTVKDGGEFTDTVKVENGEGLRYGKPQQVLDALLGEIGFDPFRFTTMKPADQAKTLLEMVPLSVDLDEHRELDQSDYAKRRDVNRDVDRLAAQLSGLPVEDVPADAPDRDALVAALGSAADTNVEIDRQRRQRQLDSEGCDKVAQNAANHRERVAELRAEADRLEKVAAGMEETVKQERAALIALPPLAEPVDTDAIRAQLRDAEAVLTAMARQKQRGVVAAELESKRAESKAFTEAMEKRAKARTDALGKAKMPIPGLGLSIDDKGDATVTLDGVPFQQGSKAQKLRASTAIAMAANPTLRVLRIEDGSLLDDDSLALLAEMANEESWQLWIEQVGTHMSDGTPVGIIMEDGSIKGVEAPPAEEKPKGKPKADKPDGALL
jgi:hypothetical protein